jgi:hypothetical protein
MSDSVEKPTLPADLHAETPTQHIAQLPQQELNRVEEDGNASLILTGKALAVALSG